MLLDPAAYGFEVDTGDIGEKKGLAKPVGLLDGERGTGRHDIRSKDEASIAVTDVESRPHRRIARTGFGQRILWIDRPILRVPPIWTPSANRDAEAHRDVERRSVDARLPS